MQIGTAEDQALTAALAALGYEIASVQYDEASFGNCVIRFCTRNGVRAEIVRDRGLYEMFFERTSIQSPQNGARILGAPND